MITKEDILNDICKYSGFNIANPIRKEHIILLRNVYYRLCKDFTDNTLKEIGQIEKGIYAMNITHSSVKNGLKKFEYNKDTYNMHTALYNMLRFFYKENEEPYYCDEETEQIDAIKKTHTRKDLNTLHSLNVNK